MSDLREALKRTIKAIRAHSPICVHTHNDICDEFDAMLAAHPPDETLTEAVNATNKPPPPFASGMSDYKSGWNAALDYMRRVLIPKPTTEPDASARHPADETEKRLKQLAEADRIVRAVVDKDHVDAGWGRAVVMALEYERQHPTAEPNAPKPGECEHHRIDCALHSAVEELTPVPASEASETQPGGHTTPEFQQKFETVLTRFGMYERKPCKGCAAYRSREYGVEQVCVEGFYHTRPQHQAHDIPLPDLTPELAWRLIEALWKKGYWVSFARDEKDIRFDEVCIDRAEWLDEQKVIGDVKDGHLPAALVAAIAAALEK